MLTLVVGDAKKLRSEIFPISWESFFAQFDLLNLAFAHDDSTSRFEIVQFDEGTGQHVPRDLWA